MPLSQFVMTLPFRDWHATKGQEYETYIVEKYHGVLRMRTVSFKVPEGWLQDKQVLVGGEPDRLHLRVIGAPDTESGRYVSLVVDVRFHKSGSKAPGSSWHRVNLGKYPARERVTSEATELRATVHDLDIQVRYEAPENLAKKYRFVYRNLIADYKVGQ